MKLTTDICSGALFICLGLAFIVVGQNYKFGDMVHMGPGLFPTLIAITVVGLGGILLLRGLVFSVRSEPIQVLAPWPLAAVIISVVAFGTLIDRVGLLLGVTALVVVSRLLGERPKLLELTVLVAILVGISYGVFIYALEIPIKVWI